MAAQNLETDNLANLTDAQRSELLTDTSGKGLVQSATGGAEDTAGFLGKLEGLFHRLGSRNNLYSSENDFAKKALKPNRVKNAVAGVQNALHKVLHKTEEADSSGKRNNPWNTKNPWNNVDVNGRARKDEETGDEEDITGLPVDKRPCATGLFFVMGTEQKQLYCPVSWKDPCAKDRKIQKMKDGEIIPLQYELLETILYVAENIATDAHHIGKNNPINIDLKGYPVDTFFDWSDLNGLTNDVGDRRKAAERLAKYVLARTDKDNPITLIGYSHGGNVALQAAPLIYEETGKKINIITLSTPAANYGRLQESPQKNTLIQNSIFSMYHFWIKGDIVAGIGSHVLELSGLTYNEPIPTILKQFELNSLLVPAQNNDVWTLLMTDTHEGKHGWPYYPQVIRATSVSTQPNPIAP